MLLRGKRYAHINRKSIGTNYFDMAGGYFGYLAFMVGVGVSMLLYFKWEKWFQSPAMG